LHFAGAWACGISMNMTFEASVRVNRTGFAGGSFVWVTPPTLVPPAWHNGDPRLRAVALLTRAEADDIVDKTKTAVAEVLG
jgi:hypothetical protein